MSKCLWCPNCPNYTQKTSYGTEELRCCNTDCALYWVYKDEEEQENGVERLYSNSRRSNRGV